ncbi:MAG: GFA family protein [Alteraurantiacibacter sp.]
MSKKRELHSGGCHCGAVRFAIAMPDSPTIRRCNCTICSMKGVVMLDVPLAALEITRGEDALTLYTFGSGEAKHRFCSKCGIHPFHQTRSDPDKYGINLACIDGMTIFDFPEVPVFDGRNHPMDTGESVYLGVMRYEPQGD